MKREYYVIELTNGEFASFHQETDTDLKRYVLVSRKDSQCRFFR